MDKNVYGIMVQNHNVWEDLMDGKILGVNMHMQGVVMILQEVN